MSSNYQLQGRNRANPKGVGKRTVFDLEVAFVIEGRNRANPKGVGKSSQMQNGRRHLKALVVIEPTPKGSVREWTQVREMSCFGLSS